MNLIPVKTRKISVSGKETSVYIIPDMPFWFIPSPEADKTINGSLDIDDIAMAMKLERGVPLLQACLQAEHLLTSFSLPERRPHEGRSARRLEALSELWFHLTDACNLGCAHCLFSNNMRKGRSLPAEKIMTATADAYGLGCRVICFTGGEPFVYPGFMDLVRHILEIDDTMRVAALTNGLLLKRLLDLKGILDTERLHLQVSLDGPEEFHDRQRGKGTFAKTSEAIKEVLDAGFQLSVAMAVNSTNAEAMALMPGLLRSLGVDNLHFQWHFERGAGKDTGSSRMEQLIQCLRKTCRQAKKFGISIDNVEAVAGQLFSPPGTRFDLGNGGWESVAVGPDGAVFPTPAMVDRPGFMAGNIDAGIKKVWQESPVLERIRSLSLTDCPDMLQDPWRFIIGGGDIDHCAKWDAEKGEITLVKDPYSPVYIEIAYILLEEEVKGLACPEHPGMALRMGDVSAGCPSGDDVNFTHCNCLLSMGKGENRGLIRDFYSRRAETPDELILNPVKFQAEMDFIPEEARVRMYGCGSPVDDAEISPGEVIMDLGSGTGVECFLAAKRTGPKGRVIGVDMTDRMLELAGSAAKKVERELGYGNVNFIKGYLEHLPVESSSVDVVISNCVLNLTRNKRRVLSEIIRVLKPGGRMVISDVVTEREPPPAIRADHQLSGECIGGAMVQDYLFALIKDTGFKGARAIKRFPYREVQGHAFFSLTFMARRPDPSEMLPKNETQAFYAGPFQAILGEENELMIKGRRKEISPMQGEKPEDMAAAGLLLLDDATGAVTNMDAQCDCACFLPPEPAKEKEALTTPETGCLVCGRPLVYLTVPAEKRCAICGNLAKADAMCEKGHFVCDLCHIKDPVRLMKEVCLKSKETDTISLLNHIRGMSQIPLHGPEHHGMVPGVILTVYRNLGGAITDDQIIAGIERGAMVPGGACAFMGVCGAVTGTGVAFSIMLESTPLTPAKRKTVQSLSAKILEKIGRYRAARCCQRECYISLLEAARVSKEILPIPIRADGPVTCRQRRSNRECIRSACPFYPKKEDIITGGLNISGSSQGAFTLSGMIKNKD